MLSVAREQTNDFERFRVIAVFEPKSIQLIRTNISLLLPFLAQECAFPPACSVKALHFASMNAKPATLTARAAKRRGPPRRALLLFFKRKSRLKRKKEQMPERQH